MSSFFREKSWLQSVKVALFIALAIFANACSAMDGGTSRRVPLLRFFLYLIIWNRQRPQVFLLPSKQSDCLMTELLAAISLKTVLILALVSSSEMLLGSPYLFLS